MKIDEISSEKDERLTERVTIALKPETYAMLEILFRKKGKRPSTLGRELFEEFVRENQEFFDTAS